MVNAVSPKIKNADYKIKKKRISIPNCLLNLLFIILCLAFVYPVVLTIAVSFTENTELLKNGYALIPKKFSIEGYKIAMQTGSIFNAYKITVLSCIVGTILSVLVMLLFAYPISRKDFKHKTAFTFFAYFSTFLSGGLVPWYILCTQILHIDNTFWALFLPHLIAPMYIIILRTFINSNVPDAMIEAAKIDGASEYRIFWQFIVPLAKPGIATIALFKLLEFWNDYYLPMMLISDKSLFNLQYYLQVMFQNIQVMAEDVMTSNSSIGISDIPTESTRMAMCVLTMGPILVVYPFFQKYFVKGLTIGSVKG